MVGVLRFINCLFRYLRPLLFKVKGSLENKNMSLLKVCHILYMTQVAAV